MRTGGGPRTRASVRERGDVDERDAQYDLLTAALLGVAIGVGTTLLLRRGPGGERPMSPLMRGAARASRQAAKATGRGARWAGRQGAEALEHVPYEKMEEHVRDYLSRARDAIDDAVDAQLHDLRRSLRRQRRRFGV